MPRVSTIDRSFGTWRGLVRLIISHGQSLVVPRADLTKIRRLVFVCHGNICRSSYADVLAQDIGLNSASFGLSTTSGLPAHPPVTEVARELNVDLTRHRTTAVGDFQARPDDLMLVMEVRQIARLHSDPRFDGLQIDLLGRYAGVPHLHDPYRLSESYVRTCLKRIDHAVRTLAILVPGTKAS